MDHPRVPSKKEGHARCCAVWGRAACRCLGDKKFGRSPSRLRRQLPFNRERQLGSEAFLASSLHRNKKKLCELAVAFEPSKTFQTSAGEKHEWTPIKVLTLPQPGRLEILREIGQKCKEYETLCDELAKNTGPQKIPAPENKATKKAADLPEGEYICKRFATTIFRNSLRTILFLLRLGKDKEPTTDEETPTHGAFLEKEIAAMGGADALEKRKTPLRCLLGEMKTTQNKRKCRVVTLA